MNTRSYIVDLSDPLQLAEAYESYIRHGGFLLRTDSPLSLLEAIRIQFLLPKKSSVVLLANVVSELPNQGFGLQIPECPEAELLATKGIEAADRLRSEPDSLRAESAKMHETRTGGSAPPPSTVDRIPHPSVQVMDPGVPQPMNKEVQELPVFQALRMDTNSKTEAGPASTKLPGESAEDVDDDTTAELTPPAPSPSKPLEAQSIPDTSSESDFEKDRHTAPFCAYSRLFEGKPAEELTPSPEALVERIRKLDQWVAQQGSASTLQAAPKDIGDYEEASSPDLHLDQMGAELRDRVLGLKGSQKKRLAVSGSEPERRILIHDPVKQIHLWVLKNPELTADEAADYASLETLSQEGLEFLLSNPRWSSEPQVIHSLLHNAMVPPEVIPRLLIILETDLLNALLEDPRTPALVHGQALRIVYQREEL